MSAPAEQALKELGVTVQSATHEAVLTVDALKEAVAASQLPGNVCKNLFLKAKKQTTLFLVVVAADQAVDLKSLGKHLGVGSSGLRFASQDVVDQVLKVPKGAVTPLAVINDAENVVQVVLDETLRGAAMCIHPLVNTATVSVAFDDVVKFLSHFGKEPMFVDFSTMQASAQAKPAKGGKKKGGKKPAVQQKKQQKKKGETMLGIDAKKGRDFAAWYREVIYKGELIEYYDVSGCYILRPNSYFIWDQIRDFLDAEIKKLGVENTYFPLFVTKRRLEAEESHIEGFAAEVAWVTKSGTSDMSEPIAIRPTSETVMYPAFKKWIKSHRDLPLRLNQWCNVVRWEFSHPTPFIRTREFLWQEGHSAFASKHDADTEVLDILELYARVYQELLAIPVVKGVKTEMERFPGGDYTTTVEAFVPGVGRGVQGATSHGLGHHFGEIFDISFEDTNQQKAIPYQNSWGMSTRTIGVCIMVHSDDKGLVLPPRVAKTQAVVVPIVFSKKAEQAQQSAQAVEALYTKIKQAGVRVHLDDRSNYTPGWKFSDWELKGVPVRVEVGPKDIAKEQCILVRRDNGESEACKWDDVATRLPALLEQIQADMLQRATEERDNRVHKAVSWEEFMAGLNKQCMVIAPHCNGKECEEDIKQRSGDESKAAEAEAEVEQDQHEDAEVVEDGLQKLTGAAKSLCIPFEQPKQIHELLPADDNNPLGLESCDGKLCVGCGKEADCWILFGRSY